MWNSRMIWRRPVWTIRTKMQLLESMILQMTGKTVEVEMLLKKTNMHQDLAEISVDDILKQTVHMDIVVEEEPDDE